MKLIIKNIFYIGSFVLPGLVYAQSCDFKQINPEIEITINKLVVDQQKNVAYLKATSKGDGHSPVGKYDSNKQINVLPKYIIYKSVFKNSVCAELTSFSVKLVVSPVIYIATEAQQYACTKNRVYAHEMLHYQTDMNAVNKLPAYLKTIISKTYKAPFYAENEKDINAKIKQYNTELMKLSFEFLRSETDPIHAKMDTAENYKREQGFCSTLENVALMQLIGEIK